MSERYYPIDCQSAYCGRTECPSTCKHLPKLNEFKEWRDRTKAVRPDPIWFPTWWQSTVTVTVEEKAKS